VEEGGGEEGLKVALGWRRVVRVSGARLYVVDDVLVAQASVAFDVNPLDQPLLLRGSLRLLRACAQSRERHVEEHEAAQEGRHETEPGRANSHRVSFFASRITVE